MSTMIATPRRLLPLALAAMSALLAPRAFAGFELVESAAAPVPYVSSSAHGQDTAQMQQTINALNTEIQSLRVRLAAAEADASGSRQELLAIRARQDHIQSSINHMTLNFAFGHSRFNPGTEDGDVLVRSAQDALQVRIIGFTDSVGTVEANRRVALLRAQAAKMYLVRRGVAAAKISAEGQEGEYIASNDTAGGRAVNRRVEFEFFGQYQANTAPVR